MLESLKNLARSPKSAGLSVASRTEHRLEINLAINGSSKNGRSSILR